MNSVINFILKYVELLLNVAQIVSLYLISKSNLIEYGYYRVLVSNKILDLNQFYDWIVSIKKIWSSCFYEHF